jgi:hypothetical protein
MFEVANGAPAEIAVPAIIASILKWRTAPIVSYKWRRAQPVVLRREKFRQKEKLV